ncbi:MAG TPA: cytochrome C oxidase subunit IV family protein [Thermoanaerobaculia bacterium]|jgi:cytochrome c oxidase subunit IV|nr:cytochrome C oxidase subunit IV family protein [Thermoanaerobaculia bacterium]
MSDEITHREELAADEERRVHQQPNYMAIFWWLFGLTVVEVSYSVFTHPPKLVLMTVLVGLAIIKATMVALFFMHLRFERKSLGIIFASTLILGLILVSVGIAEQVLPRP